MQSDNNLSPIQAFFKNKWVRVILIIDIVILIPVIILLIINATKVSVINLNIAPIDATISINGNSDYQNGSYSITPGTYEIQISRDGLTSKTLNVDIPSHYDVTVSAFLSNDGDFTFYKLKDNFASYYKLSEIASASNNTTIDHDTSAEDFISYFEHVMSIQDILPIEGYVYADPTISVSTVGFTIQNGEEGCEMSACLLVNYRGVDYEEAVKKKIEEVGYNSADYQILYEEFSSYPYPKNR